MENLSFLQSTVHMPLMSLPVTTTIVPLAKGKVMISPGSQLTPEQLASVSDITDLVAPSLLHCGGMQKAVSAFPKARVWGPQGASKRKPEIKWTHELHAQSWIHQEEFPLVEIKGAPLMNEIVFFDHRSRTLILCDLTFNLKNPKGLGAWIVTHLFGTYKKFAVSRLTTSVIKDRKAFEESVKEMLSFDFDNVVMSHGEPIRGNGKAQLREAFKERGYK